MKNNIPIISLTAYTEDTDKKKCLQMGADAFLKKPVLLD